MTIWFKEMSLSEMNTRAQDGFTGLLGMKFLDKTPRSLTATLTVDPTKLQPMGIMHGGVTASLAESVASAAANFCVDPSHFYCVGLELNINHLKAVTSGELRAIATPFHLGRTTQVWGIQILDQLGRDISVARLTVAVLTRETPPTP